MNQILYQPLRIIGKGEKSFSFPVLKNEFTVQGNQTVLVEKEKLLFIEK